MKTPNTIVLHVVPVAQDLATVASWRLANIAAAHNRVVTVFTKADMAGSVQKAVSYI